ncbi:MAG: hypothetical protein GX045_03175 [Clostridiaceae bacterium]|nr:hypothetical protein [Clostridiaceae bacterium]
MKQRIIAWIALVLFLLIVINILFIHIYVTESVIVFMLYFFYFFFVRNRNSFLYYAREMPDPESEKGCEDAGSNTDLIASDETKKTLNTSYGEKNTEVVVSDEAKNNDKSDV